mmetsp:Transcript_6649/g.9835  ORF Transcript_6649/g.9835 Transcript_6649/m.9835 type:complete len:105 (-) Transcript_6649:1705-2019(-)
MIYSPEESFNEESSPASALTTFCFLDKLDSAAMSSLPGVANKANAENSLMKNYRSSTSNIDFSKLLLMYFLCLVLLLDSMTPSNLAMTMRCCSGIPPTATKIHR